MLVARSSAGRDGAVGGLVGGLDDVDRFVELGVEWLAGRGGNALDVVRFERGQYLSPDHHEPVGEIGVGSGVLQRGLDRVECWQ